MIGVTLIVLMAVFMVIVEVIISTLPKPESTETGKEFMTFQEFTDEHGMFYTSNEIGQKIKIKDKISQIYYLNSEDTTGMNFVSTGTSTDTSSPSPGIDPTTGYYIFDVTVAGDKTDRFQVGNNVTFIVEISEYGYMYKEFTAVE